MLDGGGAQLHHDPPAELRDAPRPHRRHRDEQPFDDRDPVAAQQLLGLVLGQPPSLLAAAAPAARRAAPAISRSRAASACDARPVASAAAQRTPVRSPASSRDAGLHEPPGRGVVEQLRQGRADDRRDGAAVRAFDDPGRAPRAHEASTGPRSARAAGRRRPAPDRSTDPRRRPARARRAHRAHPRSSPCNRAGWRPSRRSAAPRRAARWSPARMRAAPAHGGGLIRALGRVPARAGHDRQPPAAARPQRRRERLGQLQQLVDVLGPDTRRPRRSGPGTRADRRPARRCARPPRARRRRSFRPCGRRPATPASRARRDPVAQTLAPPSSSRYSAIDRTPSSPASASR